MEIPYEQLEKTMKHLKDSGNQVILCNGSFDILHDGHINLFKKGKELGKLVAGIETDQYIKDKKGSNRPKNTLSERIKNLLETNLIDFVFTVPYTKDTLIYRELHEIIKPDYLLTAEDELLEKKNKLAGEFGVPVIVFLKSQSSSDFFS